MARKPNYGLEKRKKEQDRKAKKDAKKADRQLRRDEQRGDELGESSPPTDESAQPDPSAPGDEDQS